MTLPESTTERPLVVHFVTGGGSGATRVALDVARLQHLAGRFAVLLVLRKKSASLPPAMLRDIDASGLPTVWVDNLWPRFRVVGQLVRLCERTRPAIFFAHGYSEHLWGRAAALKAGVPRIVHVEHNLERYSFVRRWQARRLAPRTDATVCVSGGVAERIAALGLGAPLTQVILNGSDVARFAQPGRATPLAERPADIVMVARFARQKDHATLLRAVRILLENGWGGRLLLAGDGKKHHRVVCEKLGAQLGLGARVEMLGRCPDLPGVLHRCRVSVLSTRYEGLPLSLVESMAAGCLVVASDVPGVRDIVRDGVNGHLVSPQNPADLARVLGDALANPQREQAIVNAAHRDALGTFSLARMVSEYDQLCLRLLDNGRAFSTMSEPFQATPISPPA